MLGSKLFDIPSYLSLLGDYRRLYLEQKVYFMYLYGDKQICTQRNCIQDKKYDRFISYVSILGWLPSPFKSHIFRRYEKFWRIWRVIKLYVHEGQTALFDFQ